MAFRLLIVDDDAVTLLGLREGLQLRFADAIIVTAGSAEDALTQLHSSGPFDLVLSDVRMPGMDGLGLLREIKTRFPDCVVFLMTAADENVRMQAFRLGAASFIEKPLDMQRLLGMLSRALHHGRQINIVHDRNRRSIGPDQ